MLSVMPLSTLTISKSELDRLGPSAREILQGLCKGSEEITKNALEVPDPNDAESRIIVLEENDLTIMEVSFTVGDDVYGYMDGIKNPSFKPTYESKKMAAKGIQALSEQLGINCKYVDMEAWSNTIFSMVTAESEKDKLVAPMFLSREAGLNIKSSKVKFVVSPNFTGKTLGTTELPPSDESEVYSLKDEIQKAMKEILALDEAHQFDFEFVEAFEADAALSIEVDLFQLNEDNVIPIEVLQFINDVICVQLLEGGFVDESTQEGEVELWVRQGSPEITSTESQ
jgi:hypothetical protein